MKRLTLDLEEYDKSSTEEYDVCVIGSGPAGMALVSKFLEKNINVVILESGQKQLTDRHSKLNEAVSIGEREIDAMNSRARRYGGAMQLWAGTSAPFSKIEFLDRPEINVKGWPISWEELEPYYKEAAKLLGVKWELFSRPYHEFKTQMSDAFPNLLGSILRSNNYFAAKDKDLTKSLKTNLADAQNIDILTNATVTDFVSQDGKVNHAIASTINGRKVQVHAKYFVLCTGALEVVRTLLNSNIFDQIPPYYLGRNFMSHPSFTDLGTVYLSSENNHRKWVNQTRLHTKVDFELTFNEQKQQKVLRHNITMSPTYVLSEPLVLASSSINKNKKFSGRKDNLMFDLSLIYRFWDLICRIFRKRAWTDTWHVSVGIEQEPIETRTLTLSDRKDETGVPQLILNGGEISQLEKNTISAALKGLGQILEQKGVGKLELSKNFLSGEYLDRQDPINHHIGTARMASSDSEGVVDKNLKIFDQSNLYISSSAVFPTSSNANPTFTIVALSLRLGDHLKKKIMGNL